MDVRKYLENNLNKTPVVLQLNRFDIEKDFSETKNFLSTRFINHNCYIKYISQSFGNKVLFQRILKNR